MLREKLLKRSPIRAFENALNGGLGGGNLGVIVGRKGVGKTASLVHIATDKLMRDQNVLHVSFADDPQHIIRWYEQVFREVAATYNLEDAMETHDAIIRNRLVLHFKQRNASIEEVEKNIDELENGINHRADTIIVDGFQFENETEERLKEWKALAKKRNTAIWFSATMHRENPDLDEQGIPAPVNRFADLFEVIIMLKPKKDHIEFDLLKSHPDSDVSKLAIKLDPKTMLLANHRI